MTAGHKILYRLQQFRHFQGNLTSVDNYVSQIPWKHWWPIK